MSASPAVPGGAEHSSWRDDVWSFPPDLLAPWRAGPPLPSTRTRTEGREKVPLRLCTVRRTSAPSDHQFANAQYSTRAFVAIVGFSSSDQDQDLITMLDLSTRLHNSYASSNAVYAVRLANGQQPPPPSFVMSHPSLAFLDYRNTRAMLAVNGVYLVRYLHHQSCTWHRSMRISLKRLVGRPKMSKEYDSPRLTAVRAVPAQVVIGLLYLYMRQRPEPFELRWLMIVRPGDLLQIPVGLCICELSLRKTLRISSFVGTRVLAACRRFLKSFCSKLGRAGLQRHLRGFGGIRLRRWDLQRSF